MYCLVRVVIIATLLVFCRQALAVSEPFQARGNEPSWSLRKMAGEITFQRMGSALITVAPVPTPIVEVGTETFKTTADGKDFVLVVAAKRCNDSMSGRPYPASVSIVIGAETFKGCGGDPAELLRGEWRISQVDGKPVIAPTKPSLDFSADGKVSGNGSCNRVVGSYTLSGEGLSIGQLGSSMMMCEDSHMAQERVILEVLRDTKGFAIGDNGTLILKTNNGRTITALR